MVSRHDESTGRQALTDDTINVIMMGMCQHHLVLNSDRYHTYPNAKLTMRDSLEQLRHKSGLSDVGEMSLPSGGEHHGE